MDACLGIEFDKEAYFMKKIVGFNSCSDTDRAKIREITENLTKEEIDDFDEAVSPQDRCDLRNDIRYLVTSCVNHEDCRQNNNEQSFQKEKKFQEELMKKIKKILESIENKIVQASLTLSLSVCAEEYANHLNANDSARNAIQKALTSIFPFAFTFLIAGAASMAIMKTAAAIMFFSLGGATLVLGIAVLIYAKYKKNQENKREVPQGIRI